MTEAVRKNPGDPSDAIVSRQNGVRLASAKRTEWPGLSRLILKLEWETEPGWIEFTLDQPACFALVHEIGGRGEFRLAVDRPYEGEYIGAEQVSLIRARTPVSIHADEMRRATLVCCALSHDGDGVDPAADEIAAAPDSLMIKNRTLHDCMALFEGPAAADPAEPFSQALARSVRLAWAAAARARSEIGPGDHGLSGEALARVLGFIRNELDEPIRIAALAEVARLSTTAFGSQFLLATGMTPQAWQMDARVRNAQRLMIDDPKGSLAEFAQLCGFADQSHFSRVFLKIVGTSPTEWLSSQT